MLRNEVKDMEVECDLQMVYFCRLLLLMIKDTRAMHRATNPYTARIAKQMM